MNIAMLLVYVAGAFVFLKLINYGLLVKALLGLRFKDGGCRLCQDDEMPGYVRELLHYNARELENRGFVYSHSQLCDMPIVSEYSKRWNVVYFEPNRRCYACLSVAQTPDRNAVIKVEFSSHFADGKLLLTVNGLAHEMLGSIPNTIVIDPYAVDIENQLKAHLTQLEKLGLDRNLVELGQEGYVHSENKTAKDHIDKLYADGLLTRTKDGYGQIKFFAALRQAFKCMRGLSRLKELNRKRKMLPITNAAHSIEIPLEVETEAFLRTQAILAPKKIGYSGKILVFIVSMVICGSFFGIAFRFEIVPILLMTLLLHELGHAAGMRLFKYQDVQIMFLPFGAITTGLNKKVGILAKVIVLLLGPAPGIVLGTVAMYFYHVTGQAILKEAGLFLLVLNYLNLLPIIPLDGGRVFELTLFARLTFLKSAFMVLSTLVLLVAGMGTGDWILGVFGGLLGFGIPHTIRRNRAMAKLRKRIKEDGIRLDDESLVPAIFSVLRDKPFAGLAWAQRYQLAKSLRDDATTELPTGGMITVSLLMYLLAWLLPVIVLVFVFLGTIVVSIFGIRH